MPLAAAFIVESFLQVRVLLQQRGSSRCRQMARRAGSNPGPKRFSASEKSLRTNFVRKLRWLGRAVGDGRRLDLGRNRTGNAQVDFRGQLSGPRFGGRRQDLFGSARWRKPLVALRYFFLATALDKRWNEPNFLARAFRVKPGQAWAFNVEPELVKTSLEPALSPSY